MREAGLTFGRAPLPICLPEEFLAARDLLSESGLELNAAILAPI